jgi:hypothetical protein
MNKTFINKSFSLSRLSQSGSKSSWASHSTGSGFFKPMSDEMAVINGLQAGQAYTIAVDPSFDIRVSDRLAIDGDTFEVKGTGKYEFGSVSFKRVLLTKELTP